MTFTATATTLGTARVITSRAPSLDSAIATARVHMERQGFLSDEIAIVGNNRHVTRLRAAVEGRPTIIVSIVKN